MLLVMYQYTLTCVYTYLSFDLHALLATEETHDVCSDHAYEEQEYCRSPEQHGGHSLHMSKCLQCVATRPIGSAPDMSARSRTPHCEI